jgi:hypothetical protein
MRIILLTIGAFALILSAFLRKWSLGLNIYFVNRGVREMTKFVGKQPKGAAAGRGGARNKGQGEAARHVNSLLNLHRLQGALSGIKRSLH